ncbi:MAG: ADP-forming succinate--CoA ligase subunit beta [Euryarchaeota archaeon]|nr:ADP-forming succinate--CoA ligase subunit beta [Euryarchaeota archaeon]
MNIHEYQGKQLFKMQGLPVQNGIHCKTIQEAVNAYESLGSEIVAVKSQIHAGGRGKGTLYNPETNELVMEGGVKIAFNKEEVEKYATSILGNKLVTKQTGTNGKIVNNVYIEAGCSIAHEYYLAILIDREMKMPLIMASIEGGMDIEEVAENDPEAIHKIHVDLSKGLLDSQINTLCNSLKLNEIAAKSFAEMIKGLFTLFVEKDCSMVEINPLVRTTNDDMVLLDAKVGFDENALFRHRDILDLRDLSEEEATEVKAKDTGLSYVKLEGNIGCLVNGAGLAMATMDVIKLYGGEPANFLDVGGGANEEQVKTAFSIILDDPAVKGILVNIFGGIMRCDIIARGVIGATQALDLDVPLVVRLVGTNFEEGRKILSESDLNIHTAETLAEGAQKIVSLIGGEK